MLVNIFRDGLNTQISKYLLKSSEAQVFKNVNSDSGALKSVNKLKLFKSDVDKFFYKWNGDFISFQQKTYFVEFNRNLIYNSGGKLYKYTYSGESLPLGIPAPQKVPIIKSVKTSPDAVTDVTVNSVADSESTLPLGEELKYWIFNIKNELWSPPYEITAKVLDNKIAIEFSNFTDAYDKIIIYRFFEGKYRKIGEINPDETFIDKEYNLSQNELLDFELMLNGTYKYCYTFYDSTYGIESQPSPISEEVEVENGSVELEGFDYPEYSHFDKIRIYRIGGNLSTFTLVDTIDVGVKVYVDSISDVRTQRHILDTYDNTQPPENLKYLTMFNAILFGTVGNKLWFSKIGEPDYFPEYNFIVFEDEITGLAKTPNGLLVFLKNRTYIIVGTNPNNFAKYLLSDRFGCVSHDTIASIDNAVFWLSDDGIISSDGARMELITRPKVGLLKDLNPIKAVVWDGTYWLLCEDKILYVKFKYNNCIGYIDNDNPKISWIEVYENDFYGWAEGSLFKMFEDEDNLYELSYKSPAFTEGSLSNYKLYNSIYIAFEGDFTFNIYIDNKLVQTITRSSKGLQVEELLIPQQLQRGYSLELEIKGTGVVYEYEYKVTPRQVD